MTPGLQVGIYPGEQTAGTEVSSTYEGRHLQVLESELTHPYHSDGLVDKGEPVVLIQAATPADYGYAVGVAFRSAGAATEYIAVDTEGIWNLLVYAEDDAGNAAIEIGDVLYIRAGNLPGAADADGTGDAEISKIVDQATQVVFGYALGRMVAGGSGQIAVKVHASPSIVNSKRTYYTVSDGQYVFGRHHTSVFAGGQSTGLEYFDQQVTGVMDGDLYGWGTWMELAAGFTANPNLLVAHDIGIYDEGATLTGAAIILQQMQAILASAPDTFHWWRLNYGVGGGSVTALIQAANPASLDYANLNTQSDPPIGYISFATIVGVNAGNPVQIRVYADRD